MSARKNHAISICIFVLQVVLSNSLVGSSTNNVISNIKEIFNSCSILISDQHCRCNHSQLSSFMVCNFTGISIIVRINAISIKCNSQTENVCDSVPPIRYDIKQFHIDSCMLLELSSLSQKFNMSKLNDLTIENCVQGNEPLPRLDASFFGEINTLESLTINNMSNHFSEDLFENFPNLITLRMEHHEFREMRYLFENIPKLKVLKLAENQLENMHDNVFGKLNNLLLLDLSGNKLTRITAKYFKGLKHLKSLGLGINCISHIEENSFSDLEDLVYINLTSNQLGNISSNIFKNNMKLEIAIIDGNPQIKFPDYLFANLENLKTINISNNQLENILEHTFENCTNLSTLEMQNNNLKQIPLGLFKTLKKMMFINLSNNKLKFFSREILSSMENLEELHLEGNYIEKISHILCLAPNCFQKLRVLNLKRNNIVNLPFYELIIFRKLIKLDLSYNQLIGEYTFLFDFPEVLEQINLSHNQISSISTLLDSVTNLREIDLSYNSLTEINLTDLTIPSRNNVYMNLDNNLISHINLNNTAVQKFGKNKLYYRTILVDMFYNPLLCDCRNYEFFKYLQSSDLGLSSLHSTIIFKKNNMVCVEPKKSEIVLIENLSLQKFTCEVTTIHDCPSKCTCLRRPYDNAFIVDCSFRNLDNPPTLSIEHEPLEIILKGSLLRRGPKEGEGYENVTILDLSKNKLISFDWCPSNIEKLNLSHNNLKVLSSKVLNALNSSSKFTQLTLGHNPWTCDCSALELRNFIQTHRQKIDTQNVLCENDKNAIYDRNDLCKPKFTIASLMLLILLLISTVSTVLAFYLKYQQEIKIWLFSKNCCLWLVIEEELDKDKIYDIFLCFSHKDEDFVIDNLVTPLEKSFKVCIHSRDWVPGELINHQIVYSVYNSRRTVVVLSNDFLESAWGRLEFLIAHKQSLEERRPRVVVIKLGDLNEEKLDDEFKAYMKTNTYVEWGETWFWKKLFYSLPHSRNTIANINQQDGNLISDFELEEL